MKHTVCHVRHMSAHRAAGLCETLVKSHIHPPLGVQGNIMRWRTGCLMKTGECIMSPVLMQLQLCTDESDCTVCKCLRSKQTRFLLPWNNNYESCHIQSGRVAPSVNAALIQGIKAQTTLFCFVFFPIS